MVECVKKHIITIVAASIIVVAVVVTVVVVVVTKKGGGGGDDGDKEKISLTILKKNSEIKRQKVKLNAEFELVKMGNNMTGLIINDPYASKFYVLFMMNYGGYIDTVSGISHFGEHMILQSSEKYNCLNPFVKQFTPLMESSFNAMTSGTFQGYYISVYLNLT